VKFFDGIQNSVELNENLQVIVNLGCSEKVYPSNETCFGRNGKLEQK
jgi:hypothetical protein